MNRNFPPTVIIRSPKEHKKKCTIWALKERPDIIIRHHPIKRFPPLAGYVRLSAEGDPLTTEDSACGLLILDSSWRRVKGMLQGVEHLPTRSLLGYHSAFPRVSKLGSDPENGLATVEALFLAYQILGRPTDGILDHYLWAREFLQRNGFSFS